MVETPSGAKRIDEVVVGEKVLSPSDDGGGDEFVDVVDIYDNGTKDIYEIELFDGKKIRCTLDHKFLCSDNKKYKMQDILDRNLKIMVKDD